MVFSDTHGNTEPMFRAVKKYNPDMVLHLGDHASDAQELEDRFPWCKGKPYLLPAAWCVRAFRAVTQHGDLILKWSKDTGKIKKEEIDENRDKLRRFGIEK
jgi:hypothetical protein